MLEDEIGDIVKVKGNGRSNTSCLILGTSTCTTEAPSPKGVNSNRMPITSGEDGGLCYQNEGGRGVASDYQV